MLDSINLAVIHKIKSRAILGQMKYHNSMDRTDLTVEEWLKHAQEEALDLAVYLEKILQEINPND